MCGVVDAPRCVAERKSQPYDGIRCGHPASHRFQFLIADHTYTAVPNPHIPRDVSQHCLVGHALQGVPLALALKRCLMRTQSCVCVLTHSTDIYIRSPNRLVSAVMTPYFFFCQAGTDVYYLDRVMAPRVDIRWCELCAPTQGASGVVLTHGVV